MALDFWDWMGQSEGGKVLCIGSREGTRRELFEAVGGDVVPGLNAVIAGVSRPSIHIQIHRKLGSFVMPHCELAVMRSSARSWV